MPTIQNLEGRGRRIVSSRPAMAFDTEEKGGRWTGWERRLAYSLTADKVAVPKLESEAVWLFSGLPALVTAASLVLSLPTYSLMSSPPSPGGFSEQSCLSLWAQPICGTLQCPTLGRHSGGLGR